MVDRLKLDYKHSARYRNQAKLRAATPSLSTLLLIISGFILLFSLVVWRISHHNISTHLFAQSASLDTAMTQMPQPVLERVISPALAKTTSDTTTKPVPVKKTPKVTQKTLIIKPGDTLSDVFIRENISLKTLYGILGAGPHSKRLTRLYPNQKLIAHLDENHQLNSLDFPFSLTKTLHFMRQDDKFVAYVQEHDIETKTIFASAEIKNSLYLAAKKSDIEDKIIMNMEKIFGWDIDFALDIHPKDKFKIIYEKHYKDGKFVGVGNILAAEFKNHGKVFQAFRFTDKQGKHGYFDAQGRSLKKAFIRTPVKFTRISSYFSLGRKHPILHRIRAHKGVDYAAPRGTPVKASGNGKVAFIGRRGGYGNAIILQHGRKYSTLYGHLNKFAKGLKKGQRVKQGQLIAYVGSTGLATGPHLHYEFRVNNKHHDPLTVPLPKAKSISNAMKTKFNVYTLRMIGLLNQESPIQLAQVRTTS